VTLKWIARVQIWDSKFQISCLESDFKVDTFSSEISSKFHVDSLEDHLNLDFLKSLKGIIFQNFLYRSNSYLNSIESKIDHQCSWKAL